MLDARCQAMVEAGALRPSSLMRAELTGRVDLRAEDLRLNAPAPGTSVTDKMLHLLQATSCRQRESNMMMRSEWGGPEGAVDAALTAPAGLTATQIDPRHPDLTREQEAASDKEYNLASTQPWQGMTVHPWSELLWPDFTLVDQKVNKETKEALNAQQVYPTGVVTGTLMWDRRVHQLCVLSEKTRVQWELMEMMVRHTMAGSVSISPKAWAE
ncbi:hypothetical protein CYMTET_24418 [Cymbomonas tetramitiformis]|uniref:Uncharacterized protein n=1 Tax=Cymbomonas tetramitiformis TaxID=36881 RepID=A0AAE0FW25_9CHLO|nr:hypothetical protein CYMTET_24418 [Cymbomonas tetramitiformis]